MKRRNFISVVASGVATSALIPALSLGKGASAKRYKIGNTVVIHKDKFAYIVFPSIWNLDNGEWIAAIQHTRRREPLMHPPSDPLYRTMITRSSDQGQTWGTPYFAPDFDWYGVENPGITQLNNGSVLLTHFRFRWYPIHLARKKWHEGEEITLLLPRGRTKEICEEDWEQSVYPWARTNGGTYVHLSSDRGLTFDKTVKIDTSPYREGYARVPPIELSDGRVAYAVAEHYPPYNKHVYMLTSRDGGHTWEKPILIAKSPVQEQEKIGSYNEPHIAEVAPGEIYCILRDRINHEYLFGCWSTDSGKTWSPPERTPMYGHPGHLLVLRDGRLLCTYGRRKSPWGTYGVRACISGDGGRNWDIENEIIIRDDFPNHNVGYPQTIEYESGALFCAYYGEDSEGVTCVQGTYFSLLE